MAVSLSLACSLVSDAIDACGPSPLVAAGRTGSFVRPRRPRSGPTAAGSEQEWRAARAPRPHDFGLCELPAHKLSLPRRAASRQHVREPGRPLSPSADAWPSRGADLAPGYRFRPPFFARARLPARASHRRWSPIRIRRCSSTPHPVTKLPELKLDAGSRPLLPAGPDRLKSPLRAPSSCSAQKNCHMAPNTQNAQTPARIPIADDDGTRRPRAPRGARANLRAGRERNRRQKHALLAHRRSAARHITTNHRSGSRHTERPAPAQTRAAQPGEGKNHSRGLVPWAGDSLA